MSHLRQPAASFLPVCLPEVEGSQNAQLLPALSGGPCLLQRANNKVQLPTCTTDWISAGMCLWIADIFLSVCRVTRAKNLCVCIHVRYHAGSVSVRVCVCVCVCVWVENLLSNNFHIRLILKGQKLLGSQQWADGGWLNMHLIPFGLVSVSKPPTFLSHNHSYRFSNQSGAPAQTRDDFWSTTGNCHGSNIFTAVSEGCLASTQSSMIASNDREWPQCELHNTGFSAQNFHSFSRIQQEPPFSSPWAAIYLGGDWSINAIFKILWRVRYPD